MPIKRPHDAVIQGFYCPYDPARTLARVLRAPRHRLSQWGLEKQCCRCSEWWPADTEFYFATEQRGATHCHCRACYAERRWPERYGIAAHRTFARAA